MNCLDLNDLIGSNLAVHSEAVAPLNESVQETPILVNHFHLSH